jgi:hypothetical protein
MFVFLFCTFHFLTLITQRRIWHGGHGERAEAGLRLPWPDTLFGMSSDLRSLAGNQSCTQPGTIVKHDGTPHIIQNCICIHEEDAGVLWKHTDFRPGGRSQTVRRRRLVVSMVCTLANYGEPN